MKGWPLTLSDLWPAALIPSTPESYPECGSVQIAPNCIITRVCTMYSWLPQTYWRWLRQQNVIVMALGYLVSFVCSYPRLCPPLVMLPGPQTSRPGLPGRTVWRSCRTLQQRQLCRWHMVNCVDAAAGPIMKKYTIKWKFERRQKLMTNQVI